MTPLAQELVAMIHHDGPITLERYMDLCLAHPEYGYYMSRDPFGRSGDFTTAPEISQMFGELIGIWCVSTWQLMQTPGDLRLIEIGPGRGTLMADLLRATNIMPNFAESVSVHFVETSPALKALQAETLKRSGFDITWHDHIEDVPAGPCLIVANEFLDALPVRQLQKTESGWHERMVGLTHDDALSIGLSTDPLPPALVPGWAKDEPLGAIAEVCPARDEYCKAIATRLAAAPGAALFIDYGHTLSGAGDTLQAVQKHNTTGILHQPGNSDLTAHVDFQRAATIFSEHDLAVHGPITQSRFLAGMGLAERLDMLTKRGDARRKLSLQNAAQRLVAGNQMGQLFKVLIATHRQVPEPAPFAQMAQEAKT